ncbi:Uncharacterised protein [Serratia liquefaciens]|jgi:hypothetical protein|nr:Uncharacterised protein [Serratia liquefaciens]CAI2008278.1 Uncharacterised protein [Serratia liquefaciens]
MYSPASLRIKLSYFMIEEPPTGSIDTQHEYQWSFVAPRYFHEREPGDTFNPPTSYRTRFV